MRTRAFAGIFRFALPALGALVVIGLGIYLSATVEDPQAAGKTNIRWVVDPHKIRHITIDLFERSNPDIHVVNDTNVGNPDIGDQLILTQLAGDFPPDVMALYTPENIRSFTQNDLLLDLRPYIKKYHIHIDDLWPQVKPYMYDKDKIIGISENCYALTVFYNKKLFREAGVPFPRPHWTWDECLDAARKLTKYKTVNGRQVTVQKGLYIVDLPDIFVWMYGGKMFSDDGKRCLIDEERAMRGIRYWSDMRLKYKSDPVGERNAEHGADGRLRPRPGPVPPEQGRDDDNRTVYDQRVQETARPGVGRYQLPKRPLPLQCVRQ